MSEDPTEGRWWTSLVSQGVWEEVFRVSPRILREGFKSPRVSTVRYDYTVFGTVGRCTRPGPPSETPE